MLKEHLIGLDFETYSAMDLMVHGLDRYTGDATFRPLIACTMEMNTDGQLNEQAFDFIQDKDAKTSLLGAIDDKVICAHNAGFERAVLSAMGIHLPASRFIDSAVVARMAGASGRLEAAAPQLLGTGKLESGRNLIQLFSVPHKDQTKRTFDVSLVTDCPDQWQQFIEYCMVDAQLSLRLVIEHGLNTQLLTDNEQANACLTLEMNQTGWPVDVATVEEMQRRYLENQLVALQEFRMSCDAPDLNLNSLLQMKEWCADRGVRAKSFDEKNVESLKVRLWKKVQSMTRTDDKYEGYIQVLELLETKQVLGGSSLKKLQVILDTVGADGRLHDQYLHCGAGQTYRTTGRSVQMQNLKRLAEPADMSALTDVAVEWNNTQLAENLRQVFTSSHPQGKLIVGDFASVESRGLAWLAGEDWKLDSYNGGHDMYKVLAQKIYGVEYGDVTKVQRQTGKVGELSCGYGAGPDAVQQFAANMGVEMTEAESAKLVRDWRDANPAIVLFWTELDKMLDSATSGVHNNIFLYVGNKFRLSLTVQPAPQSLRTQHAGVTSMRIDITDSSNKIFMSRVFHGIYRRGRDLCYYKPSQLKGGDLWSAQYMNPKTKQHEYHKLYGGKLAGIVTQSFCRELFFGSLRDTSAWVNKWQGLALVGQFHDEIVLDWTPDAPMPLSEAEGSLQMLMSDPGVAKGFPLAAEVKSDYRYIK